MRAERYSWALFAVTCAGLVAYAVLYAYPDLHLLSARSVGDGFPILPLGLLLSGVLGALIVAKHPRHPIGWLLAVSAAGGALGFAAGAYAYRVLTDHRFGPDSLGHLVGWVGQFFGASFALALMCVVFLLVPDGRLLSRRWRPVIWLGVASYLLWAGVLLVGVRPQATGPDGFSPGPVAGGFLDLSTLMLIIAILASAVSLVLRLRRSSGVQRQQMRWIMASCALFAGGLVAVLSYQAAGGPADAWWALFPLFVGYTSLPVFTAIAVLRYRLYDLDVIINRAVVLAVLTAFVTIAYVAVVVGAAAALDTPVLGHFWPSLLALVVVAIAFQPLRLRVQRFADRLVYGRRAAPYEALAEFSRRLGRSPAAPDLLPPIAEAVAGSVGAAHASVSLDVPGTTGLSAAWPVGSERVSDVELEVRDRDETLGRIAVRMPPGRGLRPAERKLLEDFAAQAGLAFRNLSLDGELRARVEQLAHQSAELAASRRRLVAARDGERQRIAAVIEREVLSHLRPIPAAVSTVDASDVDAAERDLDRLQVATSAGLEALREVTRGLFPALLTRQGLVAALRSHCERRGRADLLTFAPELEGRRFGQRTESVAYFCCVALIAESVHLDLSLVDDRLVLRATGRAIDQQEIIDRVEAAGGTVSGGRVEFGVLPDQVVEADAQTAASRSVPNADLAM